MSKSNRSKLKAVPEINRDGFFLKLLIAITIFALILRLLVAWEISSINGGINSMFTPAKTTDLATYMDLAKEVASGNFKGSFYYQPFYYAVFLASIYLIVGTNVWFTVIVQAILSALTCFIAGLLAKDVFGKRAGIVAAFLTSISTALLLYVPFYQNETLQAFNLTLLAFLVIKSCSKWNIFYWTICGLVTSVAILTRGNIWLLLPIIVISLIWSALKKKKKLTKIVLALVVFTVSVFVLQIPFIWRNTLIAGKLTGPSTAADAVLALRNTIEAPPGGRNPGLPAGPMEYPAAFNVAMEKAKAGTSVGQQMFQWLMDSPLSFLELQFRKLLLFWDYREIPNNVSLYGEGSFSNTLQFLLLGRSGVIITFALAGMILLLIWLIKYKSVKVFTLLGFIVVYWGAIAIFYNLSRFRAPILPLCAVAASFSISFLIGKYQKKKLFTRENLPCLLLFVFTLWVTFGSFDFYRDNLEANIMKVARPLGTILETSKDTQVFDYGPFSFGNWQPLDRKLYPNVFKKSFSKKYDGTARWYIFSEDYSSISIKSSDNNIVEKALVPGQNYIETPCVSGVATLEVVSIPDNVNLVFDTQRNYNRSWVGNIVIPGEFITRLYINKE
jgi:4-amino-4-deoxy-L-arabinose transferase-like glycosyltransferase